MLPVASIGGSSVEVAGCQGVECVPAANLQACGGLSLSPVGNYALQVLWRACGAFLWLCRVPASTLMLMGGGVSGMMSAACIGGGVACVYFQRLKQRL